MATMAESKVMGGCGSGGARWMRRATALLVLAAGPALFAEQDCNERINATAGIKRLAVQSDGTVLDARTGLRWMRCPLGYALNDNGTADAIADDRCEPDGQALYDWQGALQGAEALNLGGGFAGLTGWRVPNVKELASIVERKCIAPALDTRIFPGVPETAYWSSTTYNLLAEAATFDFQFGTPASTFKSVPGNERFLRGVRLVR